MDEVKPTVISTFAGCGGSSLGYHLAGFKELLAVEWDDNAAETFKLNFPDVPLYHGDIAKLSVEECLTRSGLQVEQLDVFDGSPPCQGFSTAGNRKFSDPRNSLFKEYVRLLKGLQPKVFVMENVTGMIKGYMKQAYLLIIAELRDCGYQVKGQVLNAMYYNVPQSRQRVIIIGVRNDLEIQPSHPTPQTKPITVKDALQSVENKTFGEYKKNPSAIRIHSETKLVLPGKNFASSTGQKKGFNLARLHQNKCAPTILKSVKLDGLYSGLLHFKEDRLLSIEELQRLGSFPDEFQFIGAFEERWARIGNSVPPNLMKAIALHIKAEILSKI